MPTTPPAGAEPDSAPLPAELVARLQVWRAVHTAQFLAGVGIDDARVRPAELAATIVDRHGRRLARVLRGPLFAGPLEVKAGPDAAAQWHTVSR